MELNADEPGMVRPFHDFRQFPIGRHAGENEAIAFQSLTVARVHLIAVAVAFGDRCATVNGRDMAVSGQCRLIRIMRQARVRL